MIALSSPPAPEPGPASLFRRIIRPTPPSLSHPARAGAPIIPFPPRERERRSPAPMADAGTLLAMVQQLLPVTDALVQVSALLLQRSSQVVAEPEPLSRPVMALCDAVIDATGSVLEASGQIDAISRRLLDTAQAVRSRPIVRQESFFFPDVPQNKPKATPGPLPARGWCKPNQRRRQQPENS